MSLNILVRLAALLGGLFILLAAIVSAFSVPIARRIKKPFTLIHHPLAITGGILVFMHPLLVSWQVKSIRILAPSFVSWHSFWNMAGCPALALAVAAVIAALLMRRIPRYWRQGHWLIYPFMCMAGIHGMLTGRDLRNPFLAIPLSILLAFALGVFVLKRLPNRQRFL